MRRTARAKTAASRAEITGDASAEAAYLAVHADAAHATGVETTSTEATETGSPHKGTASEDAADAEESDPTALDATAVDATPVGEEASAAETISGIDLTAAAFFDVDNTMMQGASLFHFARGLAARKFFTSGDVARFAWRQMKFRIIGSENLTDASDARAAALSFVAGRRIDEIVALGEEIYDEILADKIYPGTRRLAEQHLRRGERVWLVTATPVELAQVIARRLGLTGALGTVAETRDGVYTGRLVGDMLHGPAKAAAVRGLAAREGLHLRRCTAYSDSINDAPMLSVVGTAVAINPDAALRDLARRRGWKVRDYRTGRKAAKIGVPSVLGMGAIGGAVAAAAALRRRRR